MSGALGLAIGLASTAVHDLAAVVPSDEKTPQVGTSAKQLVTAATDYQLEFFPSLGTVEAAVAQAQEQTVIRREATRHQRLMRTKEVLTFNGSTTEDITRHVKRQFVEELPAQ